MLSIHLLLILLSSINGSSASTCKFDARLQQDLLNQGIHRNISYIVTFGKKRGNGNLYDKCYVGIDQKLPAGVYAYPDELRDLKRMNKLLAIPRNKVNIELPAEQSQPTSVFIIGKVKDEEVNLWLPVHARYHHAQIGGNFVRNDIETARVFLQCPHIQLEKCRPKTSLIKYTCDGIVTETCIWKEIPVILLTEPTLFVAVPIGNIDDNNIVWPVTIGAVVVFSVYLLRILHEYKLALLKRGVRF